MIPTTSLATPLSGFQATIPDGGITNQNIPNNSSALKRRKALEIQLKEVQDQLEGERIWTTTIERQRDEARAQTKACEARLAAETDRADEMTRERDRAFHVAHVQNTRILQLQHAINVASSKRHQAEAERRSAEEEVAKLLTQIDYLQEEPVRTQQNAYADQVMALESKIGEYEEIIEERDSLAGKVYELTRSLDVSASSYRSPEDTANQYLAAFHQLENILMDTSHSGNQSVCTSLQLIRQIVGGEDIGSRSSGRQTIMTSGAAVLRVVIDGFFEFYGVAGLSRWSFGRRDIS